MRRTLQPALTLAVLAAVLPAARAEVKPHPLIGRGMVLQQGVKCPIWGTADYPETVKVTLKGDKGDIEATPVKVKGKGAWRCDLPPMKAGGPFTLTIKEGNTLTLEDVYVGEVWICSGQSNMEWGLGGTAGGKEAIEKSKNPKIRLFTVDHATSFEPLTTVKGSWSECGPGTVGGFSAVGYYFGRDLNKALDVPIGLIHSSWGGTVAEAWTPRPELERHAEFKYMLDNLGKATQQGKPGNPNIATVLYNGMIHPLRPFAFRGAIWYQGESNAGRAYEYRKLFPTMIESWRKAWELGDFPFLFVQLAPFMAIETEPKESAWAELREAQLLTAQHVKNTGMAVITDVGDPRDIHPQQKGPVGARLALAARALAYKEKITYSGPMYDSMQVEGNKVIVSFKHLGQGLEARDGELRGFAVAGKDRKFYNAQARIAGDKVEVWSDKVPAPVAARYGWANCPVVNLWNKDGLPASPFRTDDFPMVTGPKDGRKGPSSR
jgi:sialate O-acetylesterase